MRVPLRLSAEWSKQSSVMIAWPHEGTDWADQLPSVEQTYLSISQSITQQQMLLIVCHDNDLLLRVQSKLSSAGIDLDRVRLAIAPTNDTWIRDYGPLSTLQEDHAHLYDFRFNGWGGQFPADLDDKVTRELVNTGFFQGTPCTHADLILEGGAVETDGEGTLLARLSAVLSETRNPGLGLSDLEQRLKQQLGIEHFLWLNHGHLSGDDTDGHIDTLARFSDAKTILYTTAFSDDPDFAGLHAMEEELKCFRTKQGEPYRLIPLPPIRHRWSGTGTRLPASYANFLVINGAVLLPVYDDPSDQAAIECLGDNFPGRRIIPIDCQSLTRQNGSLHCVTMQFPAAVTPQFQA